MHNAMMNYDRFNNMYIDKKKSTGRIDIVDAIINCMCRFVEDEVEVRSVYETRDIFIF
jgi:phage terminase large subunit-like protein